MRFTILNPTTGEILHINLPAEEKELQRICDSFDIPNDMKSKIIVEEVESDHRLNYILQDNSYNLEELNFLMNSMDRYMDSEADTFYAAAYAMRYIDMTDLINLSFNIHCYSVLSDFKNLNELGRDWYMNEHGSMATSEFDSFDGRSHFAEVMSNNPSPMFSPYGFVYKNETQPEVLYTGKTFPVYLNGPTVLQGLLKTETANEYLALPFEQSTLDKVIERLEVASLDDVKFEVMMFDLPDNVSAIVLKEEANLLSLNEMAKQLKEVGSGEYKHLSALVEHTEITEPEELSLLIGSMHEFELFPNVNTAEDYGRYMICDSGRFEYDDNLEEYIDFKAYGDYRLSVENGAFTNEGYLIYHGYNLALANILEEIDIEVPQDQTEEVKLYMPLKVITYDQENDWGIYEESGCEEELDSCELLNIEHKLRAKMEEYSERDGARGLMEYYDKNDSVNAKVQSFHFDFEEVDGDLFGVAVLKINAPLTAAEWSDIKDYVTGQCSDGAGENFEQREFDLDGRDVYVSLWNSDGAWKLKTAEEMGVTDQSQGFEMSMN